MKKLLALLLTLTILAACAPESTSVPITTEAPPWWRTVVFYEIFVRSFSDSDGDGIGDFNGLTSRLDYLQDLGIGGIWLMPIHPSPSYHGYDVVNYYAVSPEYGTLEDFRRMVDEAHERNIRVIIDLVLNHTSSQHPFFVSANQGSNAPYRDWYVWAPESSGNHWYLGQDGYYFSFFSPTMPDLNYTNPDVTSQMYNVVRYWLEDVGIDGFRIDAVKHLIEEGALLEGTQATHEWLREFHAIVKQINPQSFTVGEVYGAGAFAASGYTGDQMDEIFNFEMSAGIIGSALGESNTGINSAISFALEDMPDGQYATFLANHDQNRVMSSLRSDPGKARLAAALLLTLPGTPFLYYGEEIGLQGKKPDEDLRLPMQWTGEAGAGFTTGTPWREPWPDTDSVTVASQDDDPQSLLNFYRTLIALRNSEPALQIGDLIPLQTGNKDVFAMLRLLDRKAVLVLINLSDEPVMEYGLETDEFPLGNGSHNLEILFGANQAAPLVVDQGSLTISRPLELLDGYGVYIWQVAP